MKVLYVLSYLSKNGGVQSVVNNYFKHLNKNIQVDFLVLLPGDKEMEEEIRKKGCNIYYLKGSQEKNLFLFLKEIKKFFREHHDYDILHNHQTNLDIFYLREAKKWKIPVRIMHAHSTRYDIGKIRMLILRLMSKVYSNYYFACSKEAGQFMFGKNIINNPKFYVINNAIYSKEYNFNSEIRDKVRKENNLENNLVIGNVSRMVESKNHEFLLEIFYEILKIHKKSKLLLVGNGPLENKLKEKVKKLNIEDNVIFYGVSNKVNEILQGIDVFVLPSIFEGVPVTIIEAAASGVKYVISDTIDSHLKHNDLELKLNLNLTAEEWAKSILEFAKKYNRENQKELIKESGFDIEEQTDRLEKIYLKIMQGEIKNAK